MTLRQFTTIIVSTLAIAASISTAEARNRSFQYSHSRNVQGPNGRGLHSSYNASRGGGQAAMSRNVQTMTDVASAASAGIRRRTGSSTAPPVM